MLQYRMEYKVFMYLFYFTENNYASFRFFMTTNLKLSIFEPARVTIDLAI